MNERVRIPQPTGELLPAEERLQNVLKAIENRLLAEHSKLVRMDADDEGNEAVFNQMRGFVSGLDIAWSLAQTESVRRQTSDGVPDLLPPAP